ncbi:hypothetical protein Tco_1464537 [Tanacetum coccineum]
MVVNSTTKAEYVAASSCYGQVLWIQNQLLDYGLKRVGDELEQEKAKKQKIDDDQEEAKMKKLMEIVPGEEEVAVNVIPLATKPPSIVDWKIVKEGNISFF